MHDTFFMKNPGKSKLSSKELLKATKKIHETGDFGSIGYRYKWKEEIA